MPRKSPPLKGDNVPQVALLPTTFVRRNEAITHFISNGYTAADVGAVYGISRSQASAIARRDGVKSLGSKRGYKTTDPLKIISAARAPGVVSRKKAASDAGVSTQTAMRVMDALGMHKAILRLFRLRRCVARNTRPIFVECGDCCGSGWNYGYACGSCRGSGGVPVR